MVYAVLNYKVQSPHLWFTNLPLQNPEPYKKEKKKRSLVEKGIFGTIAIGKNSVYDGKVSKKYQQMTILRKKFLIWIPNVVVFLVTKFGKINKNQHFDICINANIAIFKRLHSSLNRLKIGKINIAIMIFIKETNIVSY